MTNTFYEIEPIIGSAENFRDYEKKLKQKAEVCLLYVDLATAIVMFNYYIRIGQFIGGSIYKVTINDGNVSRELALSDIKSSENVKPKEEERDEENWVNYNDTEYWVDYNDTEE